MRDEVDSGRNEFKDRDNNKDDDSKDRDNSLSWELFSPRSVWQLWLWLWPWMRMQRWPVRPTTRTYICCTISSRFCMDYFDAAGAIGTLIFLLAHRRRVGVLMSPTDLRAVLIEMLSLSPELAHMAASSAESSHSLQQLTEPWCTRRSGQVVKW
jgi:hypothetical protein